MYVIEHLEEGFKDSKWSLLEYEHILNVVGKQKLLITNIKPDHSKLLSSDFKVYSESITKLSLADKNKICFMDMRAKDNLTPDDSKEFEYLVYGGVLGDHPPRDRCKHLRDFGFKLRKLGNRQMTTDTAVMVSRLILEEKKKN